MKDITVSSIIANLYMEHFVHCTELMHQHDQLAAVRPIWYRYVDDTFICINRNAVQSFTHHIDDSIRFKCDPENDCQLPFLDTSITKTQTTPSKSHGLPKSNDQW